MSAGQSFAENTDLLHKIKDEDNIIRNMKPSSLFFIWFAANLTIGDFAVGFIPVSLGTPVSYAIAAIITGNITGGALLGIMSMVGAKTGRPQMALSLGPFSKIGSKILAILQWGNTLGWLTVNLVLASFALHVIFPSVTFLIPLLAVALIVFALAYAGHQWIRRFEVAMSVVLGVLFAVISVRYLIHAVPIGSYSSGFISPLAGFGITLASSFSYIMAWGPYASDYSRFMKPEEKPVKAFLFSFIGGSVASFWIELIGVAVALSAMSYLSNPASALAYFMGRYAALGMISLFLGGIAANAINLFSNATSMGTAVRSLKGKRALILGAIVSFSLGIIGYGNFYSFYETFLFILDYWITPWLGVLIAYYFIYSRRWPGTTVKPFSGVLAYAIAVAVSIPFMSPGAVFEGPLAYYLGSVDISYYISFTLALVLFVTFNSRRAVPHDGYTKPTG